MAQITFEMWNDTVKSDLMTQRNGELVTTTPFYPDAGYNDEQTGEIHLPADEALKAGKSFFKGRIVESLRLVNQRDVFLNRHEYFVWKPIIFLQVDCFTKRPHAIDTTVSSNIVMDMPLRTRGAVILTERYRKAFEDFIAHRGTIYSADAGGVRVESPYAKERKQIKNMATNVAHKTEIKK
ncbi:hypothetical protein AGMMS49573_09430 [Endomicrobiia bacterium]|nr:hypothetical protein AGMMS49573_09430 [Endomicrobiia bacterium]